jgi:DASH complex subunit DAD3
MSAFAPEDLDNDYSYAEVDPAETSTPPIPQSMGDADASHSRGHSNNPLLADNPLVSDLEQEVLEEYARLLRNVNQVCRRLAGLDLIFLGQSLHGKRIQAMSC